MSEPCRGEVGLAGPAACASASASSGAGGESFMSYERVA